jgi:hypothetical protein
MYFLPSKHLKRERKKGNGQGRKKVRSRRASLVEILKSSMKEEDNRVVVRIKTRKFFFLLTVSECFL